MALLAPDADTSWCHWAVRLAKCHLAVYRLCQAVRTASCLDYKVFFLE